MCSPEDAAVGDGLVDATLAELHELRAEVARSRADLARARAVPLGQALRRVEMERDTSWQANELLRDELAGLRAELARKCATVDVLAGRITALTAERDELRPENELLRAARDEARSVARMLHRYCERDPRLLHGGMQPEHPWLDEGFDSG